MVSVFFFNDTATTEIYTLSLHDALPIYPASAPRPVGGRRLRPADRLRQRRQPPAGARHRARQGDRHPLRRSEEHTSELQSLAYLVCRLLLDKQYHHG